MTDWEVSDKCCAVRSQSIDQWSSDGETGGYDCIDQPTDGLASLRLVLLAVSARPCLPLAEHPVCVSGRGHNASPDAPKMIRLHRAGDSSIPSIGSLAMETMKVTARRL